MPDHTEDSRRQPLDRRALLRSVAGLSVLPAAGLLGGCDDGNGAVALPQPTPTPTPAPAATTSFAFAVMPDTQFYARYATSEENSQYSRKFGSEPFLSQTQWIARNAERYRIPFVIHLGDVVDQVRIANQWVVADRAMQALEAAKVPYSILAGNHDVLSDLGYSQPSDQASGTDAQRNLANEPYLKNFPASRAARQATFGGRDPSGFHEYHVFEAAGVKFLVLSLSWRISDAGIAWARKVIADNPKLPVILSNHQLIAIDKDGTSPLRIAYGEMLWERLIRDNDQIFLTLNGHHHGAARETRKNDAGNNVELMVVDYQMAYQGGNGLMRLYEVDFTANRIDVLSFSPWVREKPKATLTPFDQAVLTGPNEQFTIAMDFKARFKGFAPDFAPKMATEGKPILPQVQAAILDGFTQPTPPAAVAPKDENDYPQVAETVAHWRFFGGTAGQAVKVGETIRDATGRNPITRAALSANAQEGDVTWTADTHRLSSAPGSVRFANTNKNQQRWSFFQTAADAPANAETFANGYTVEAFVKIDAQWTQALHAWMNLLGRDGNRGALPGFSQGDGEASPVLFAISSLREVQWEIVPASNTRVAQANWSGEVMPDQWLHVAVVNDPATKETILYVEGAPMLRNSAGETGIATPGPNAPWTIGAGWWDGERADPFFGSLGEIRLVAKPLAPDQWLTARRK